MTAKLIGTVALVTGASIGIGDATARALAEQGASVAVVARRKDRLDTLVSQIGLPAAPPTPFLPTSPTEPKPNRP